MLNLEYEKLPAFCSLCLSVGHVFANCRRLKIYEQMNSRKREGKVLGQDKTCQIFVAKIG